MTTLLTLLVLILNYMYTYKCVWLTTVHYSLNVFIDETFDEFDQPGSNWWFELTTAKNFFFLIH